MATQYICSKYGAAGNRSYLLGITVTTGTLRLDWTADGTTLLTALSTVSVGLTDGTAYWVRATMDVDDGAGNRVIKFYTAADSATEPTSWTQLGSTVTTAGTTSIFDSTYDFQVSSFTSGTTGGVFIGKVYRVTLYNGYDGAGTKTVDFNPDRDGSDAATSFVSSATGETWTINSSGALKAQIVWRASLLFEGTADYLKTNAFTLNQPETVYIVFKQVSWTAADTICDGNTLNSGGILQGGSTPILQAFAVSFSSNNGNLAVGSYGALACVFNGASSVLQVNNTTAVTGDFGAANMGGFILGASGTPGAYGNLQCLEAIIFPAGHDTTQRARVIRSLSRVGQLGI